MSVEERLDNFFKKNSNSNDLYRNMDLYFLPTFWFSFPLWKLPKGKRELFYRDVIKIIIMKGYPSLSITYLISDADLLMEIKKIFKTYNLNFSSFIPSHDDQITSLYELSDEFLVCLFDRNSFIHQHMVINILSLAFCFSKHFIIKKELETYRLLKEYKGFETNIDDVEKLSSSSRSILLMAPYMHFGLGYVLGDNLIRDEVSYKDKLVDLEETGALKHAKATDLDFLTLNLLTGNGLSKYITYKYLQDDWLLKPIFYADIRSLTKKKLKELTRSQINYLNSLNSKHKNINVSSSIEELKDSCATNIEFINDPTFIIKIVQMLEKFSVIQDHFLRSFKKTTTDVKNERTDIFTILEGIARELNISDFHHYKRFYTAHTILTIFPEDYFWNIETLLLIFDKFLKPLPEKTTKKNMNYLVKYLFPEGYVDNIFNNGKINNIEGLTRSKHCFKSIFTLNYDNITSKIFGDSIHLHGQFDYKFSKIYNKDVKKNVLDDVIEIDTKDLGNVVDDINLVSSTVLKGGDYKRTFIANVLNSEYYEENLKKLDNSEGDFLVVGSLLLGDPHIFFSLTNKKRTIYITYYSEKELLKLQLFDGFNKAMKNGCKVVVVKFNDLMKTLSL